MIVVSVNARRTPLAASALASLTLAGCSTAPVSGDPGGAVRVVAAENFWGSLAAQLGGEHVKVTDIVDSPAADPHDYEPSAADGRAIATAGLMIINGAGYDTWATKLAAANPAPGRTDLIVGDLVGAKDGDNPHRWYDPDDVRMVVDRITADLTKADPADAAYYGARHDTVLTTNLKPYFGAIAQIRATYAGTPVGASESIFAMIAPALGLDLRTPPAFLTAISAGADPSAADQATIDRQIARKQIEVYVYNSQNATPDVQRQVVAAKARSIPVTAITETLAPAGASFQDWQVAQLASLRQALHRATGK